MAIERFAVQDFTLDGTVHHDNPFAVDVTVDFEHASGERVEDVQGFYDGENWVVRFSPHLTGEWTGTTRSGESALDERDLGPVECVPSTNPVVHGRVQTDDDHPQRFRFEDGTEFVPLGFEFDWLFAYHQARPGACRETLETLAERGFNYVLANVYAHTGFGDPDSEHVYGPPGTYVFGGTNEDPDHEVLNPAFFDDFDDLMEILRDLGIVVHLMLQVQNKAVNWPERRSDADDRYWEYVVARYGAYPNLVWDVSKESYNLRRETGSHAYTRDRIGLLRETDAYGHLVTAHDPDRGRSPRRFTPDRDHEEPPVDREVDFVSDQIALTRPGRYAREATVRVRDLDRPYLNAENGAEVGVEDRQTFEREASTGPWEEVLVTTWEIYAGGGYSCYYYSNTAWDLVKPDPEPPGWERYAYLRETLDSLDLNAMTPAHELVSDGYCLAELGRQYLVFLPDGGDVEIDLTHVTGGGDSDIDLDDVTFDDLDTSALDVFTGEREQLPLEHDPFREFYVPVENPLSNPGHPCAITIRER